MEEFPQLHTVVDSSFNNPATTNFDIVSSPSLYYLYGQIERTRQLAMKHDNLAAAAMDSLPETNDVNARNSRQALKHLAQRIIIK